MTTLDIEILEAFESTGTPHDIAVRAAMALSKRHESMDARLEKRDEQIAAAFSDIGGLKSDLAALKWMTATLIVLVVLVLGKSLT